MGHEWGNISLKCGVCGMYEVIMKVARLDIELESWWDWIDMIGLVLGIYFRD